MNKYKFSFTGRKVGAIGIFYKISAEYTAADLKQAGSLLYNDYEHITGLKIKENGKPVSKQTFDKTF